MIKKELGNAGANLTKALAPEVDVLKTFLSDANLGQRSYPHLEDSGTDGPNRFVVQGHPTISTGGATITEATRNYAEAQKEKK